MQAEPTVFVVDDEEGVRKSLKLLIHSVNLPAEVFSSAQEFLDAYQTHRPGCLVLDIRMPQMSGLDLQDEMNRRGITLPVIFMTGHGDVPSAVRAMKRGAFDFIEKPFRDQVMHDCIYQAFKHDAKVRSEQAHVEHARRLYESLTDRERTVMGMVASGKANKVIAMDLGVTQKTVEFHRANVMHKLQVQSLADLVQLAALLELPELQHNA